MTGCSGGIGYQTALALARAGYETLAGVRNLERGRALESEAAGLPLRLVKMDVDDAASAASAVSDACEGGLDVLVNNAGYGQFGCAEDVTVEQFRRQFETNFFSVVDVIRRAAPSMRARRSGTIVNIGSVAGRKGLPGSPAYISSKFALEGLTECLRYELGRFGVGVTIIEPGVVKTGFFSSMRVPGSHADPEYEKITKRMLSGLELMVEAGTPPSKVADAVVRAASARPPLPRYVVGDDATMFMEARRSKSDAEFEKFMSAELFPE